MNGRRLYEIVIDELRNEIGWTKTSWRDSALSRTNFSQESPPPAWAFLFQNERDAWNAAAKRLPKSRAQLRVVT